MASNRSTTNTTISTKFVGPKFQEGENKYRGITPATNGKLYLIPSQASKVISFDPFTNRWKEIGDDLGEGKQKWESGVQATNGKIYCPPYHSDDILIIDTTSETVELMRLPRELHGFHKYKACAPSLQGEGEEYIYFFPANATKILKLNTTTTTIVTIDVERDRRHWNHATTSSTNGHIYVTSSGHDGRDYVMDFDPYRNVITNVRLTREDTYSKLVEYDDGKMYALSRRDVMKLDVGNMMTTTEAEFVKHDLWKGRDCKCWFAESIFGRDGRIYTLSYVSQHVVQYDPKDGTTTAISTMEIDVYEDMEDVDDKSSWWCICIGKDGNGYCAPYDADHILKICIPRGHWFYLKYRILVHDGRAIANGLNMEGRDQRDLAIVQKFITHMNDDEFRYTLEFL